MDEIVSINFKGWIKPVKIYSSDSFRYTNLQIDFHFDVHNAINFDIIIQRISFGFEFDVFCRLLVTTYLNTTSHKKMVDVVLSSLNHIFIMITCFMY